LTVVVNTGDDIEIYGLHISPDIDIVAYTMAGIVDEEKGWGVKEDTFHFLEALRKFGDETWFGIGDKDLATHTHRTILLKKGLKLSRVTAEISRALGLSAQVLPMTDDPVETRILTESGWIHFQEYLVRRQARDEVLDVAFKGAETAKPAPGVIDSIREAEGIIICPSNPIVSIGSILSIHEIQEALKETEAKKIAISPIVAGSPVKGPADKLMAGLGIDVSAFSVATLYKDFTDTFILDTMDSGERTKIENLGVKVKVTNTVMKGLENKIDLAKSVMQEIQG
jgi:LPPG:FO 2-phospho-L-lactate transferase